MAVRNQHQPRNVLPKPPDRKTAGASADILEKPKKMLLGPVNQTVQTQETTVAYKFVNLAIFGKCLVITVV